MVMKGARSIDSWYTMPEPLLPNVGNVDFRVSH